MEFLEKFGAFLTHENREAARLKTPHQRTCLHNYLFNKQLFTNTIYLLKGSLENKLVQSFLREPEAT